MTRRAEVAVPGVRRPRGDGVCTSIRQASSVLPQLAEGFGMGLWYRPPYLLQRVLNYVFLKVVYNGWFVGWWQFTGWLLCTNASSLGQGKIPRMVGCASHASALQSMILAYSEYNMLLLIYQMRTSSRC